MLLTQCLSNNVLVNSSNKVTWIQQSFKWLGGLEVQPLQVTSKPTGLTGIEGIETSKGLTLVLGFSATASSLGGGNSCEVPGTGSFRESGAVDVPSGMLRDKGLLLVTTYWLFAASEVSPVPSENSPILNSHITRPHINLRFYSHLVPWAGFICWLDKHNFSIA